MTVVLCSWGDTIEAGTEESLSLAWAYSQSIGAELSWLVIGARSAASQDIAARCGVANLDTIEHPDLTDFGPDKLVAALAQYCQQYSPSTVLFNQTPNTRLIAPRLAGRLNIPVSMNVFKLQPAGDALEVTATAYGGDTHAVYRLSAPVNVISLVTTALAATALAAAATAAAAPGPPLARSVTVELEQAAERFKVTSGASADGPRLEDADIIVAGGRGLGAAENYRLVEQLATALGGMHGASRAIVDDGWIDASRQVGLTGKITRPGLYIAAGISGASQHMAGCSAAATIVAINKDPDAAIFRYARYGIVGDCVEILPELVKAATA
jgi:electron transfer flavoprotein alpha subunit